MSDNKPASGDGSGARKRAQNHFQVAETRDAAVKAEIERERKVSDAKTAKLRALRLAKEESDREAAAIAAANAPPKTVKAKKKVKT
jgi:hypothetical protein